METAARNLWGRVISPLALPARRFIGSQLKQHMSIQRHAAKGLAETRLIQRNGGWKLICHLHVNPDVAHGRIGYKWPHASEQNATSIDWSLECSGNLRSRC